MTIAVWVVLAGAGAVLHGHLGDVTAAGQSSFLPAHSQSTRVVSLLKSNFHGGENIPLFVLFDRPSGLTAVTGPRSAGSGRDCSDSGSTAPLRCSTR